MNDRGRPERNESLPVSAEEKKELDGMFEKLLLQMSYFGKPDSKYLREAYEFAYASHNGQRRRTGEPYITHPLGVAMILAENGFDDEVIVSGLLHDISEDCGITIQEIRLRFGDEVADTVDAVTKIEAELVNLEISPLDLDELSADKLLNAVIDQHNTMAAYVKCADRIHNLRTIGVDSEEKQRKKAVQTREVLIPVARKLHLHKMEEEMGALCLKIENPEEYNYLTRQYKARVQMSAEVLSGENGLIHYVTRAFRDRHPWRRQIIRCDFKERGIYSLHKDLSRFENEEIKNAQAGIPKEIPIYDIFVLLKDDMILKTDAFLFNSYDLLTEGKAGLRVVDAEMYREEALKIFILEDRFRNRYRLFIQNEKDHRKYVHGLMERYDGKSDRDTKDIEGKIPVYLKNGKMAWIDEQATVLDLAFLINPDIGLCAYGATVNNAKAMLYQRLERGDRVVIQTDHNKEHPENDEVHATIRWFEYARTRNATKVLSRWFEKHVSTTGTRITVMDQERKEYRVPLETTVLDLAFLQTGKQALCFKQAFINKSPIAADPLRRLGQDEVVRIEYYEEADAAPQMEWLTGVHSREAQTILLDYFKQKMPDICETK